MHEDCVINKIDAVKNVYKCAEKKQKQQQKYKNKTEIAHLKSTVSSVLAHVDVL